jgi:hypothetical protein
MKQLFMSLAILGLAAHALAEEHPLSTITGTQIELKSYDHAIAGSVRDFIIWGEVDEENFVSQLFIRKDGKTLRSSFGKLNDGRIGGTINQASLIFVGIDKANSKIQLLLDDHPLEVSISADSFENGHFENPTYRAKVRGRDISYTLKGHACYGYSLHLAFLILGALLI